MGPTDAPAIHCAVDVEYQNGSMSLRGRIVSAITTRGITGSKLSLGVAWQLGC